jgi:hypothetical protein
MAFLRSSTGTDLITGSPEWLGIFEMFQEGLESTIQSVEFMGRELECARSVNLKGVLKSLRTLLKSTTVTANRCPHIQSYNKD